MLVQRMGKVVRLCFVSLAGMRHLSARTYPCSLEQEPEEPVCVINSGFKAKDLGRTRLYSCP